MNDGKPVKERDPKYYTCPKCYEEAATRTTEYDYDATLYYKYVCKKCFFYWVT